MRSVLSFFSMLALGLMIAAVIMVAPSGNGTITNIAGFEFAEPTLDYRSVVAGLGIGLLIAVIAQISWREAGRRFGGWMGSQARRLWLVGWAALFVAVLFYF
jgi:hypothetical protein